MPMCKHAYRWPCCSPAHQCSAEPLPLLPSCPMRPKLAMLRTKASRAAARALTGACAMPAVRQMFSRAPLQQQRRWMSAEGLPEGDKMWYMLGVEIAGQMGDLQKDIKAANEIKAFMQVRVRILVRTLARGCRSVCMSGRRSAWCSARDRACSSLWHRVSRRNSRALWTGAL